jgi:hypothetical protein
MSRRPRRSCSRRGRDWMAAAFGFVASGVSYCICGKGVLADVWERELGRRGMGGGLTDAMKRPKAPPRANPITPETAVFPGHDSIRVCICDEKC